MNLFQSALKFLILSCVLVVGLACVNQTEGTSTPYPTSAGPALSVEEYSKACYSAFEKTLNKRGRSPTQEQMAQFIRESRSLIPPRSLERFHFAHLAYWETMVEEGLFVAMKEYVEADAQIGQMDDETYAEFEQRGSCGFDDWLGPDERDILNIIAGAIVDEVVERLESELEQMFQSNVGN